MAIDSLGLATLGVWSNDSIAVAMLGVWAPEASGGGPSRRGDWPGEGMVDRRIEPRRKTINEQIRIDDERDVIAYIDHFMRTLAE